MTTVKKSRTTRHQSRVATMSRPDFPAASLSECIESAKKVWNAEQRTVMTPGVLANTLGYRGLTHQAKIRLSALKQYRLVEDQGGNLRLSQLAVDILRSAPQSEAYHAALVRAAMSPDSFREIWRTYSDAPDAALRSHLLRNKGLSQTGARQFIRSFRETIEAANLQETGENTSWLFGTSTEGAIDGGGSRMEDR